MIKVPYQVFAIGFALGAGPAPDFIHLWEPRRREDTETETETETETQRKRERERERYPPPCLWHEVECPKAHSCAAAAAKIISF